MACANLKAAAATGNCYEALLQYKTVLNRKVNSKKDRSSCVAFVCDGVTAMLDGAGNDASKVAVLRQEVADVACQLIVNVFGGFGAAFDPDAVSQIRQVAGCIAVIRLPREGDPLPSAYEVETNRIVAIFTDRCLQWAHDKSTTTGDFSEANDDRYYLHWLRSASIWREGATQVAQALTHLANVKPPNCESLAALTKMLPAPDAWWLASKVGIQLLTVHKASQPTLTFLNLLGKDAAQAKPVRFVMVLSAAVDSGSHPLAMAAVSDYAPLLDSVDPKLIAAAKHVCDLLRR